MIWTQEALDTLHTMKRAGYSGTEIAIVLGTTRNAVIGRWNRWRHGSHTPTPAPVSYEDTLRVVRQHKTLRAAAAALGLSERTLGTRVRRMRALGLLPPLVRPEYPLAAIQAAALEGLSCREIAETHRVPLNWVYAYLGDLRDRFEIPTRTECLDNRARRLRLEHPDMSQSALVRQYRVSTNRLRRIARELSTARDQGATRRGAVAGGTDAQRPGGVRPPLPT